MESAFERWNRERDPGTPSMMQAMNSACLRIRDGEPTADDYRLVMQYPAIAGMFMRSRAQLAPPQKNPS